MRNSSTSLNCWLSGAWLAICLCHTILALDPQRALSQYLHESWGVEKGFPGGPVYALAQTTDGYLWMGTEKGLVRFDGARFQLFQHTTTPALPTGAVLGLVADAEGNLWIRMRGPRMLRYRNGRFQDLQTELPKAELGVTALGRGQNGEMILAALVNGILRYPQGHFITLAGPVALPNFLVLAVAETTPGEVWLGTRDAGLYRLRGAQLTPATGKLPDPKINCLLTIGTQDLWIGTDNGLARWNGAELTTSGVPEVRDRIQALARDRDGNVWIATATRGLIRFNSDGVTSLLTGADNAVASLLEDREGNLWLGGARGLERLRDGAFTTYATPVENPGAIFADAQNRLWCAPATGGLFWQRDSESRSMTAVGIDQDVVYSLTGSGDEIWLGRQRGGLTRLRGKTFTAQTYTQREGLAQNSVYAVLQSSDGSVWAGTLSGGVSRFSNGRFTTYTTADGLAANTITALLESADGTMWFATPSGLSGLTQGRWQSYKLADGLLSENVTCLLEDAKGVLWIGTDEGLAYWQSGRIHSLSQLPVALREPIYGIAEDRLGGLWLATANRVLQANRAALLSGTLETTPLHEYSTADGLRATQGVKRHRSVVADAQGRIWFALAHGLSVADPARTSAATAPALADVQEMWADGSAIDLGLADVRIPAVRQRLSFGFAGLSLTVPERVRFRYRMDGFDHDWNSPSATRSANYTNLGPGAYRFRVEATDSNGRWNGAEAAFAFTIEPRVWQTWWFRLTSLLAGALAVVALYHIRLQQLTRQMNLRFEERLAERTRIAQDLHDTLLQGCISASMQLHVALDQLPPDAAAQPLLKRVTQLMGQVIDEGRNAVRGLRATAADADDLQQAFARIRQELGVEREPIAYRVIVAGRPRPLHPILRDEVYRIGREALVNAFRHARATTIEVELEYAPQALRVHVRDDGCGIDSGVLRVGRDGHWGLAGMRERAERIGAHLYFRSRTAAGTEVELLVPGQIAFQKKQDQT